MAAASQPVELGGVWRFALLTVAAALLAMLAVYVGTGLHDGFGDWGLHRIGRRFRRALLWALPLAAVFGLFLYAYYRRLLRPGASGWLMLFAIVRAFGHFPLFGALVLLAMVWTFGEVVLRNLLARRAGRAAAGSASENLFERRLGPPLWFMCLPFIAMKLPIESDIEIPETVSQRRLLRWLPGALLLLMFLTDATDEDSGERIDPYLLATLASFWLGDFLVVLLRVVPAMRGRQASPTASA